MDPGQVGEAPAVVAGPEEPLVLQGEQQLADEVGVPFGPLQEVGGEPGPIDVRQRVPGRYQRPHRRAVEAVQLEAGSAGLAHQARQEGG